MAKEKEIHDRILLLEQLTLELLRKTRFLSRRRILNTVHERFSYSKPLLEIIRYTKLELELSQRDEFTKFSDFIMHRSNLQRAYDDDKT